MSNISGQVKEEMKFIGLLTHQQKQAGYFVSQDEDFVYLWHRRNGNPLIIAVFIYDDCKIKQVRDTCEGAMNEQDKD